MLPYLNLLMFAIDASLENAALDAAEMAGDTPEGWYYLELAEGFYKHRVAAMFA